MDSENPGPSLVVMAAGVARRYGGLKQLVPVGPAGEAIVEYSISDAIAAGFSPVVLVLRRETAEAFHEKFIRRAAAHVEIVLAYQEPNTAGPQQWRDGERTNPWGTAHAILCARGIVQRPFAVINADDYYGPTALSAMAQFLQASHPAPPIRGAMVGYKLRNTLSDYAAVSRGVCSLDSSGHLERIIERHRIAKRGDGGEYTDAAGAPHFLPGDTRVSMNLWGFPVEMFAHLEKHFLNFLADPREESQEYEIPAVTQQLIDEGTMQVRVLETQERWCGITYKEDLPGAQARIASLVTQGVYPNPLW